MKREESIRYEKPQLISYGFLGSVQGSPDPANSSGGDISEGCDSDFDD